MMTHPVDENPESGRVTGLAGYAFSSLMTVGYLGLIAWQIWHHESNHALLATVNLAPWVVFYWVPWQIMPNRYAYAGWIVLSLIAGAWFGLRLALMTATERSEAFIGGASLVALGGLAWIGMIAYRRWNAMPSTDRKFRMGILLFSAFILMGAAVVAHYCGIFVNWSPMSLSDWGIIAVILYLPVMFGGWFIFRKLRAVRHGA